MSPFSAPFFLGHTKARASASQSERMLCGREPNAVRDGTGKAEAAKLQDAGISLKRCPEKKSGRKRLAYRSRKIGVVPAETLGQVKRKRKSQLCDDHHRFENGARFEGSCVLRWLLPGGRRFVQNPQICLAETAFGNSERVHARFGR